jgi:hypothetical protein
MFHFTCGSAYTAFPLFVDILHCLYAYKAALEAYSL